MDPSSPVKFDFKAALARLPDQPGVYRMYGPNNTLLYVGKAKVLKNRVRSYFQNPAGLAPKVSVLMQQVIRFDYIVTDSEIEALILEYNLIKQHRPKYNILLRDDKKFPWIGLSAEPYPRLFITRDPTGQGRFFGPYVHSASLYKTLQIIRKHFPLRQRRKPLFKNRPCMNYSIGTCSGPCQELVNPKEYDEVVKQVTLFLKGKADDLMERLDREMRNASESMNFELAAKLRDRYLAVQEIVAQQKMYYPDASVSQDIVAFAHNLKRCTIVVLNIRRGKLIGSRPHEISLANQSTPEEVYNTFINQYYQDEEVEDLPDEIILQQDIEDETLFEAWLKRKRGKKVTLTHPQKGIKHDLLKLGKKNAEETLDQAQSQDEKNHRNDPVKGLIELQNILKLPKFPARMECYDISHFQGSQTVASMVVFTHGLPDRKAYRRFKIQIAEGEPNDFASMNEVISRRFKRAMQQEPGWEEPDLVIIDGGKGQLSSAMEALYTVGIKQQGIISLAKKFEEVYLPGESRPILLPRDSSALFVLQQIRDEAHRFAIAYHRSLREKKATHSILDEISGISEKRKQKLMSHFGSLSKIKNATIEEIASLSGINTTIAQKINAALNPPTDTGKL
jgi:excinuclease ABC subunit C